MALFIYNVSIFFFKIGIYLASLFNDKAKAFVKGRKGWRKQLEKASHANQSPIAWFHCASLGEFEQGRPVMEAFKKEFPTYKIFLTFFSPSGYEIRKNYEGADYIFYMPMDIKSNARFFVNTLKPSIVFFVKYEFWHHFAKQLAKREIPLLSISTIFRPSQIFFKWHGTFYTNILRRFSHFFLQDPKSKSLLESLHITNCEVTGDTRFDRVWEICSNQKSLPQVEAFKNGAQVMVVGSAWQEDIAALTSFINNSTLKFIIAPHEIDEKFISEMKNDFMRSTISYSQLNGVDASQYDVLIIDNIGMLSSLYKHGDYAYVGGGFGKGLHNILEPATFGIPIFFGNKNYDKFKEAIDLIKLGGAVAVSDYNELRMQYRTFTDAKTYEIASQINRDYVKNNTGASTRIINYCKKSLGK